MTGIYYTDAMDVLRAVGVEVRENSVTNGWQRRARSSGGFPSPGALGVQWHHTASDTRPENDVSYMINGNPDAPVGNILLDRDGCVWPIAAGAANTAGKGGPLTLSRGTLPTDGANARTWAIEMACDGLGKKPIPAVQVDAYFLVSNTLNSHFGNQPSDVFNHNTWAPTRKIDPATSAVVQGPWRPASSTSSGTWRQADVTAECGARASAANIVPPEPEPEEAAMSAPAVTVDTTGATWLVWVTPDGGVMSKCGADDPWPLGAPEECKLTADISVVPWGDGLLVAVYDVNGAVQTRWWKGRGQDWDPWYAL